VDLLLFLLVTVACIGLALLYFLPAIIAHFRGHPYSGWLLILNVFLGWTTIGWVLLLIWAIVGTFRIVVIERQPAADPQGAP
jgi:hypothetical protein